MAVLYDTSAVNASGSGTTISQAITVGINSDRILIAFINSNDGVTERFVTGVVYTAGSGGAWAFVGVMNPDGVNRKTEIWASIGPSTGSDTVQATFDGAPAAGSSMALVSVYNALQTSVATAVAYTEQNTSGIVTLAVTTPVDGLAIVNVTANSSPGVITSGIEILAYSNSDLYRTGYGSTPPTTTISWTTAAPGRGLNGVSVSPTVSSGVIMGQVSL